MLGKVASFTFAAILVLVAIAMWQFDSGEYTATVEAEQASRCAEFTRVAQQYIDAGMSPEKVASDAINQMRGIGMTDSEIDAWMDVCSSYDTAALRTADAKVEQQQARIVEMVQPAAIAEPALSRKPQVNPGDCGALSTDLAPMMQLESAEERAKYVIPVLRQWGLSGEDAVEIMLSLIHI